MLNWFRSKAALIAENDELRASLYESEGNVDMFRKSYHHEKERANRHAGNLMASRVELEMLRAREQHRIDNLRTWGRRGALVTNAKRAAK